MNHLPEVHSAMDIYAAAGRLSGPHPWVGTIMSREVRDALTATLPQLVFDAGDYVPGPPHEGVPENGMLYGLPLYERAHDPAFPELDSVISLMVKQRDGSIDCIGLYWKTK